MHVIIIITCTALIPTGKNLTGYSNISDSHSSSSNEHRADLSAEPYLAATSYCTPRANLTEILTSSVPEEFKPTEDIVMTALDNYLLEDFIVPHDHLTILETLGEGNICIYITICKLYATNKPQI